MSSIRDLRVAAASSFVPFFLMWHLAQYIVSRRLQITADILRRLKLQISLFIILVFMVVRLRLSLYNYQCTRVSSFGYTTWQKEYKEPPSNYVLCVCVTILPQTKVLFFAVDKKRLNFAGNVMRQGHTHCVCFYYFRLKEVWHKVMKKKV